MTVPQEITSRRHSNGDKTSGILNTNDPIMEQNTLLVNQDKEKHKVQVVWPNVIVFAVFHACFAYLLFLIFTGRMPLRHFLIGYTYSAFCNMGITAGAHRLWAHRSYKAKTPLKILLLIFQTLSVQNSVYEWVRDHRAHHKFSATNADPHNIKRGFFFAHVGWLLSKKHPDVKEKGKLVDLSDLESDPLIMWQHKYFPYLAPWGILLVPTLFHKWILGETWWKALIVYGVGRYTFGLNVTWLVNSYAHIWGDKPYDKDIDGTDTTLMGIFAYGEGWHNYHHVFPWDYKTSELGFYHLNVSTAFIDFFAMIGWAYDLKTVPMRIVKARVLRTGDGSHQVWGWGDKDIPKEHIKVTTRIWKK